jgi:ribosome-binding ATPase YchF (GTP1/OBG family)
MSAFPPSGCRPSSRPARRRLEPWTIHIGDTAPKAAGVIHTDFEKGFIKAEVVSFEDLMATGSVVAARAAGKARMEG